MRFKWRTAFSATKYLHTTSTRWGPLGSAYLYRMQSCETVSWLAEFGDGRSQQHHATPKCTLRATAASLPCARSRLYPACKFIFEVNRASPRVCISTGWTKSSRVKCIVLVSLRRYHQPSSAEQWGFIPSCMDKADMSDRRPIGPLW